MATATRVRLSGLVMRDQEQARKLIYRKLDTRSAAVNAVFGRSALSALLGCPLGKIDETMQTAVTSGNFGMADVDKVLRKVRHLHRNQAVAFDRAHAVALAFCKAQKEMLKPRHYTMLMGLALDAKLWREALAVFAIASHDSRWGHVPAMHDENGRYLRRDMREKLGLMMPRYPVQMAAPTYAMLLRALNCQGPERTWKRSLGLLSEMADKQVAPNETANTWLMRNLCESPRWDLAVAALRASQAIDPASAHPQFEPYSVVLSMLSARRAAVPSAWAVSLGLVAELAADPTRTLGAAGTRWDILHGEAATEAVRGEGDGTDQNLAEQQGHGHEAAREAAEDEDDDAVDGPLFDDMDGDDDGGDGLYGAAPSTPATDADALESTVGALQQAAASTELPSQLGPNGMNAGLVGAVLRAVAGTSQWERGVAAFMDFSLDGQLTGSHCSRTTLEQLAALKPLDDAFQIRVLQHAFDNDITVTAQQYSHVFRALYAAHKSDEALALFLRLYDSALVDVSDLKVSLGALYEGMLHSLLAHPAPAEALVIAAELRGSLEAACVDASGGLGYWGDPAQLWTAEGRVAVVDATMLRDRGIEDLAEHFDNVLIPYADALRFNTAGYATRELRERSADLHYVRHLCSPETAVATTTPFRVLPFVHQLEALRVLADTVAAAVQHPKDSRRDSSLLDGLAATAALSPGSAASTAGASEGGGAALLSVIPDELLNGRVVRPTWTPQQDEPANSTATGGAKSRNASLPPHKLVKYADLSTPHASALSAAVLLKKHNPDADVSVVSRDGGALRRMQLVSTTLAPALLSSGVAGTDATCPITTLTPPQVYGLPPRDARRPTAVSEAARRALLEERRRAAFELERPALSALTQWSAVAQRAAESGDQKATASLRHPGFWFPA